MLDSQLLLDSVDFEALETSVKRIVLKFTANMVSLRLDADRSDCLGSHLPCSCGAMAHYSGRRSKRFVSALGTLEFKRAYYHCRDCGSGFYPKDKKLGLLQSSATPAVVRMIGVTASRLSFSQSKDLLRELASVNVSVKQIEREAERLGEQIAADELAFVEIQPNV